MIVGFSDRDSERFFNGERVRRFEGFARQAARRIQVLDSATSLDDLRNLRSNRFEALRGDRRGQYSIAVNKQWRVCFKWRDGDAYDVEIVDYHRG